MMKRLSRWMLIGLVVGVGALASGCGARYLQQEDFPSVEQGFYIGDESTIGDTPQNREVLRVIQQYRRAMVNKDVGALKRLIAKDYYDNAGTTDTTKDDYGRERLDEIFEIVSKHAEKIEYQVTVKEIRYRRDRAFVAYEYKYAYKYHIGEKPTWDAGVEMNQVELVAQNGTWKIASGL